MKPVEGKMVRLTTSLVGGASLVGAFGTTGAHADCSLEDLRASYQRASKHPSVNSGGPYEVADKLVSTLRADCPELDWRQIKNIGMEIGKHDWAVLLGTTANYTKGVFMDSIEGAAEAAIECRETKGELALYDCIKEVACRKVGRYSEDCGNFRY